MKKNTNVISLKLSKDGERVFCLFKNGNLSVVSIPLHNIDEEEPHIIATVEAPISKLKNQILFHQFIDFNSFEANKRSNNNSLILTVEKSGAKSVNVKINSFDKESISEVSNASLQLDNLSGCSFSCDPSGKLVVLDEKKTETRISTYSLPSLQPVNSFSLNDAFANEPATKTSSMIGVANNRILVSKGSTVALIDLKFRALLGSLDFYSKSKLPGSVKPPRVATLLKCPVVAGNSMRSRKTFALVLISNAKDNINAIEHVSIDTGLGRLRDAIGKGLQSKTKTTPQFVGMPSLITTDEYKDSATETAELLKRSKLASDETVKFFEEAKQLKGKNKIQEFDDKVVAFFKNINNNNNNNKNSSSNGTGKNESHQQQFQVFEVDKDRVVDPKFVTEIVSLVVDTVDVPHHSLTIDDSFLPERAFTYLLTHPLFPSQFASGLLSALADYPRLLRQAIVTCPQIPCIDLIEQLSVTDNEDIFKDVITRLIEEFSNDKITQTTIKLIEKSAAGEVSSFDLDKIIHTILATNCGFEILNSFIDSNGLVLSLHYSKNETQLNKLYQKTQDKVNCITADTQLLTLVTQGLVLADKLKSKNKKHKKKNHKEKSSKADGHIEVETSKLSMIMGVQGRPSKATKELDASRIKIPSYSIEKLVI
ncbi:unnamed protein product [Ambrosiozyma monospora]|uniref:Unnamed protein product n=1 Tax=Ambrosiozyma monospora TaxID=43982 RepID=A0A9W6YW41_AMBMO|nr:unnamed protein product [Ambrosiozyma monospora]